MNMPTEDPTVRFNIEMTKRFEAFAAWAIDASAGTKSALTQADLEACRKEIAKLAERDFDIGERNAAIPEPSENGPQYVNVSPAPWP
jgi:hypothetical protein